MSAMSRRQLFVLAFGGVLCPRPATNNSDRVSTAIDRIVKLLEDWLFDDEDGYVRMVQRCVVPLYIELYAHQTPLPLMILGPNPAPWAAHHPT